LIPLSGGSKFDKANTRLRFQLEKKETEAPALEYLDRSQSSDCSSSCSVDENGDYRAKAMNRDKYLVTKKGQALIDAIDNTVQRKKDEDPIGYAQTIKNKSIMDCLQPKRGQKVDIPCEVKMKALKFLHQAYGMQNEVDVDYDDPIYKYLCDHDFKTD
jgi:hypothetical protein